MAAGRRCLRYSERADGGSESDKGMGIAGRFPLEEQKNEGRKDMRLFGCRERDKARE